jgi:hypothetical protein
MDPISKEAFTELAGYQSAHCISVYLPVHRAGMEVNEKQDAIAFKAALQRIQAELGNRELNQASIDRLLKPAFELDEDTGFWNNQLDGLAVFLAPDFLKVIRLPYQVKEDIYIGRVFLTNPLFPALNDQKFFVLALSKHDAIFYEGNAFGLKPIEVPGLPNGIADVVHLEEKQDFQLFRQGGGGKGTTNFHGHGEGQLEDKANIALYFQEVDRTLLAEKLHDEKALLILAGVDYLIPIYKELSKYRSIAGQFVPGNWEGEDKHTLFSKAREIADPYFKENTRKALKNYYDQVATPLTSSIPDTVIPASYYAQVSDLFVCKDEHLWGRFNETDNQLEIHPQQQLNDECLLDRAAVKTYLNGGGVYLLEKEQMPDESILAAFLRY